MLGWNNILRFTIALLLAGLWSMPPNAAELPSTWQIHGFASQGYLLTSDNNFFGNSSGDGSFDFTELGVNTSWRALPRLQLAAQLLSRQAGKTDDGHLRLDYGLLDYQIVSYDILDLGVRLGRIKNPLGLYNDTRDVAFTRPGVIMPQSIYFDRTRNLALSADSALVYGEYRTHAGSYQFQLGIGRPDVDDVNTEVSLLGANRPGDLQGRTSYLGRVIYEWQGGKLRLAVTSAQLNIHYTPGQNDPSGSGAIQFSPTIFSAQYNAENWNFTTEFARRPLMFDEPIIYIPPQLREITGESYYLQGNYRIRPTIEFLLRYDVTYLNKNDSNGKKFAQISGGTLPAYTQFAKDRTMGVRWDITRAWMIRAEYHWVDGTAWLSTRENPDPSMTKESWDMFAVLASYRF